MFIDRRLGPQSIGKSAGNDIVIDGDEAVSRLHARLEWLGTAWCITDVGSRNGTMVNGELVASRKLYDFDEIILGRTRLVLRDSSAIAEALVVGMPAIRMHLGNLYLKFGILDGVDKRLQLANAALQSGAVTRKDLEGTGSSARNSESGG